jgi:hypothetical protein
MEPDQAYQMTLKAPANQLAQIKDDLTKPEFRELAARAARDNLNRNVLRSSIKRDDPDLSDEKIEKLLPPELRRPRPTEKAP